MPGVPISRQFSVAQHIDDLLATCAQTLFALHTLHHHGLPARAIHAVFKAVVVAKLWYATPAWWGFSSAADRGRIEAFLRRSVSFNYRTVSAPSFHSICSLADSRLFNSILKGIKHILYTLLPPVRDTLYSLRIRSHNHQLPSRSSRLADKNYLMRMLFQDTRSSQL